MERIKINLPEKFVFSTEIVVRIADVNYGGHLGNERLLSIVHEARIRFLISLGYSEMNVEGHGIMMIDAGIEYCAEAFHGEKLKIEIAPANVIKMGFDLYYCVTNAKSGKIVARVKTGIILFDYFKKRVVPLPHQILKLLH